jgi:dihydrofolate reductase
MKTIIIVAMTRNRVIGNTGRIPWHDSEDLKHFKRVTTGHAVIMGRKTFEAIGKPLPGRRNIVITRRANAETPEFRNAETDAGPAVRTEGGALPSVVAPQAGVDFVSSLDNALRLCRERNEEKAFVIGGGQIYALALPIVDEMIVTWVDGDDIAGDTFFPEWKPERWVQAPPTDPSFPRAITYRRR